MPLRVTSCANAGPFVFLLVLPTCSLFSFFPVDRRSVPLSPRGFNRLCSTTTCPRRANWHEQVFLSSSIYSKACLVVDEMLPGGILESLDPDSILSAVKLHKH